MAAGARCEYRGDGSKRAPVSRKYVAALEHRIALLESFISDLKSAPENDKSPIMDAIHFADHLPRGARQATVNYNDSELDDAVIRTRWEDLGNGMTAIIFWIPRLSVN
jgi:hypothetical protein